jgi:hypothetical protein
MTTSHYRALIIAFVFFGLLGGALDLIFPALIPAEFRQLQEAHDNALSTMNILLFAGLGLVGGVCALVSTYGLFRFRPWAPRLAIWGTILALACWPFAGAYAQSGLAIATSFLASYLWGAIVVLAYVGPMSVQFNRRDG